MEIARKILSFNVWKMTETIADDTIQEIAYKLMLEQNKNEKILNGPVERTIFVLGSKGVVSDVTPDFHSYDLRLITTILLFQP